jgi:hypothetical protein
MSDFSLTKGDRPHRSLGTPERGRKCFRQAPCGQFARFLAAWQIFCSDDAAGVAYNGSENFSL